MVVRSLFSICLLFITLLSTAQKGQVSGKITNNRNETLAGVSIKIKGAAGGVQSGVDGTYTITIDADKPVEITYSYVGYQEKSIPGIQAKTGEVVNLDVLLETAVTASASVVVTGQRVVTTARGESINALIQFQKNTNTVASVISAEAIRRSPDRNTGEVLKRTPGASLIDGKFLVVRGLADRYNQAMLNGILLTSTEPDRKTFSFDIIPASMIDNIVINKAFVPEMPGEWAGGLIQVNTKDIPTKNFFNVQIGTGFNTQTIGKDFYKQKAGGLDWLGIDKGDRNIPAPYTTKNQFRLLTRDQKSTIGKAMENTWMANAGSVLPDMAFQANGGYTGTLFGKKIGATIGVNYNRISRLIKLLNQDNIISGSGGFSIPNNSYNDDRYNQEVILGAIAGFSIQLNNRNTVSVKSMVNINTNSYTIVRNGFDTDLGDGYGQENTFKQNTFFTTQLTGEHSIATPLKLKWYGSFNILDGYSPDQRRYMYYKPTGSALPYELQIGEGYDIRSSNRLFQSLSDYIYTAGGDLAYNFNIAGKRQTVKGGYMLQVKDRLYNATLFTVSLPGSNSALRQLPANQAFAPENYGDANGKLYFDFLNNDNMRYVANTILNAGFIQFDNQLFANKLRVVWGLRAENYDQLIGSVKQWSTKHSYTEQLDLLPGLNATYKLNNKTNLRLSASQTVIRPELRELASLALYDFELNASVSGNPALVRTKITNLDFRYELYQRAGEAITAGVFYKQFKNPIEQQMEQGGQNLTFRNTEKAETYGVELELRKKLDVIFGAIKNFTFQANAAFINSKVTDSKRNIDRPLVGQSPYLLNLSLMYDLEEKGLNSTLLFNQIGRRIYFLGDVAFGGGRPDTWEAPRPVLDWQISQKLMKKKAEIRLNVTDILNQKLYFFQNSNDKKTFQKSEDAYRFSRKYGTRLSLTFNYSF